MLALRNALIPLGIIAVGGLWALVSGIISLDLANVAGGLGFMAPFIVASYLYVTLRRRDGR